MYSLAEPPQGPFDPKRLELRILDLNAQTITYNLASTLFAANAILGSQFIPEDKSWIIFARHQNNNVVIDSLVIPNPTGIHNTFKFNTALRLDSNLQLIDYITYSSALEYEYSASHDTTLVFTFGADGNGYIINDGVVDTAFYKTNVLNLAKGYFVASCNLNFENFTYQRFSVQDGNAGWQTGMELKGLDIDNGGNIYAAAFHENDIIALPDTIEAFNKSWKHLSVIAKVGGAGLLSSLSQDYALEKNSIAIYPNPTLDVLHVKSQAAIRRITIIGPTGAILGTSKDSEINVSHLASGIYVLSVETDDNIETLKFIK